MSKGRKTGRYIRSKESMYTTSNMTFFFFLTVFSIPSSQTDKIVKPSGPYTLPSPSKEEKKHTCFFYLVIIAYVIVFCLPCEEEHCLFYLKVKVIRNGVEISHFLSLSQQVWNYMKSETCVVFLAREATH